MKIHLIQVLRALSLLLLPYLLPLPWFFLPLLYRLCTRSNFYPSRMLFDNSNLQTWSSVVSTYLTACLLVPYRRLASVLFCYKNDRCDISTNIYQHDEAFHNTSMAVVRRALSCLLSIARVPSFLLLSRFL